MKLTVLGPVIALIVCHPAMANAPSVTLVRSFATLPGETAQVGRFDSSDRIDLVWVIDVESDAGEIGFFAWDIFDRYGRKVYQGSREIECVPGENTIRVEGAVPTDLVAGIQTFDILAAVKIGDTKRDTTFEISVESSSPFPHVTIEDVKLTQAENDPLAEDLKGAAVRYFLEIDFRTESIIDWGPAQIRWVAQTPDGFVLDRGLAATDIDEGFNRFSTDSYLARPPSLGIQNADFSVFVEVTGYTDSAAFPLVSLPASLSDFRSREQEQSAIAGFSVGEGYLMTSQGARASVFGPGEPIIAKLLTAGITPNDSSLLMELRSSSGDVVSPFSIQLAAGPAGDVEFEIPSDAERIPGSYEFVWRVVSCGLLIAERTSPVTISPEAGAVIPPVISLPGGVELTTPVNWDVTIESQAGRFASMVTPDGIVCEILGQTMDEPLKPTFMADLYESDVAISHIPADATLLTEKTDQSEGVWEYCRRAYLTDGRVYVMSYWTYRIESGKYQFLIARCVGSESRLERTYNAADRIKEGLHFP